MSEMSRKYARESYLLKFRYAQDIFAVQNPGHDFPRKLKNFFFEFYIFLDCPIFYRRKKIRTDLKKAEEQLAKFGPIDW